MTKDPYVGTIPCVAFTSGAGGVIAAKAEAKVKILGAVERHFLSRGRHAKLLQWPLVSPQITVQINAHAYMLSIIENKYETNGWAFFIGPCPRSPFAFIGSRGFKLRSSTNFEELKMLCSEVNAILASMLEVSGIRWYFLEEKAPVRVPDELNWPSA